MSVGPRVIFSARLRPLVDTDDIHNHGPWESIGETDKEMYGKSLKSIFVDQNFYSILWWYKTDELFQKNVQL